MQRGKPITLTQDTFAMQFRSRREQQVACEVMRQLLSLVESRLSRMAPIQTGIDLQAPEAGPLLLDAVQTQYIALSENAKQLDRIIDHRHTRARQYFSIDPNKVPWITREVLPQVPPALRQRPAEAARQNPSSVSDLERLAGMPPVAGNLGYDIQVGRAHTIAHLGPHGLVIVPSYRFVSLSS